jgi:hypothetical protein
MEERSSAASDQLHELALHSLIGPSKALPIEGKTVTLHLSQQGDESHLLHSSTEANGQREQGEAMIVRWVDKGQRCCVRVWATCVVKTVLI